MDFAAERYVRIYTRDTVTWHRLGYAGQTVFLHLARKFTRAGVLDLADDLEPWEVVTILTSVPEEVARPGMDALLKLGVLVAQQGALVAPRWVEAQECSSTAAQRKRASRERQQAVRQAISRGLDVTNCDHESQDAANGHTRSQLVTVGHSVPYRTVPCIESDMSSGPQPSGAARDVPSIPDSDCSDEDGPGAAVAAQIGADRGDANDGAERGGKGRSGDVRAVFAYWATIMAKPAARLTNDRRVKIQARLREGYSVEQLQRAIDGCRASAWHMGENDRSTAYNDLVTILRGGRQVEQHLARATGSAGTASAVSEGSFETPGRIANG